MSTTYSIKMVQNEKDSAFGDLEKIEMDLLLEGIYQYYGFDFRNYAYSSIQRRVLYRMKQEKIETISSLLSSVLHNPSMMEKLYLDFSINVTEMFRDPVFFKTIRDKVLPELSPLPIIRIWHAGCSTGEEAYSMAILLYEAGLYEKARIYATDMNDSVIQKAKLGQFPLKKMKKYSHNYVHMEGKNDFSRYYTVKEDYAKFSQHLSKNMVFAQHNLVTDSSINEFHLIVCRNVLIYFNHELQRRVHELFLNSLSTNGFLALGNREGLSLVKQEPFYSVFDEGEKIFRRDS